MGIFIRLHKGYVPDINTHKEFDGPTIGPCLFYHQRGNNISFPSEAPLKWPDRLTFKNELYSFCGSQYKEMVVYGELSPTDTPKLRVTQEVLNIISKGNMDYPLLLAYEEQWVSNLFQYLSKMPITKKLPYKYWS